MSEEQYTHHIYGTAVAYVPDDASDEERADALDALRRLREANRRAMQPVADHE